MIYFDLETTNHSKGSALDKRNRVLLVSWTEDGSPAIQSYVGNIMDAVRFWAALARHQDVCAFNAKFEMHWLKRCGFDIDSRTWHDPMLAEKILLGNTLKPLGLGEVCKRYGYETKDVMIDSMMHAGLCPSEMPQTRLKARCVRDVRTTRLVYHRQRAKLTQQRQLHLLRTRCDFAVVLTHIEANGMTLSPERVEEQYSKYSTICADMQRQLDVITGGINMNSPDQKAHFLYGKLKFPERKGQNKRPLRNKPSKQFPDGRPKTDHDTMQWLLGQASTPAQKEFVELQMAYSKATAALTKNLQFFKGVCDEYGGKFHAQFNQTIAATHRLTSSGLPLKFAAYDQPKSVQFQNMPREFKSCFVAPEGYVMVEVDAMQLEFRVAAFLGRDKQALKDIADPKFDAHIFSASKINKKPYSAMLEAYHKGDDEVKRLRREAKTHTFKPLYGGTKGTPGEEAYYKAFGERYKGVAATQENWLAQVLATGQLKLPWGMRFEWQYRMANNGVAMNKLTHKPLGPLVYNYPVQNLATAEIVPIAICALYKRCKDQDVVFVNTIHDSVICYVREDELSLARFRKAAAWAFTDAVYDHLRQHYGIEFDVPLGMEMVAGKYWNEGTETKYDDVENRRAA